MANFLFYTKNFLKFLMFELDFGSFPKTVRLLVTKANSESGS